MTIFQTSAMGFERRIGSGEKPRRRLDREVTPGRCGNLDYCSIGMQRILLKVPLSQAFVCPECAGPLRAPRRASVAGRPLLLPLLRLAVLAAAVTVSLAAGYTAGRVRNGVDTAVRAATAHLDANLHEAKAALGLTQAPVQPASLPAVPALTVFVSERAYPARLPPVDTIKPAARLPGELRFGQVTLDCLLGAGSTRPSCQVTDIRGADPFSAAAVVWLQSLAVQYSPSLRGGVPTNLAHRWRVVLEDFSGTPPTAKAAGR